MPTSVQTLDISPVGRVEGDLDVRVDIQDGVVVNAWTQAELFRGFEVILRDKDPQAGLVVTPRACGICGASHLTCASWALDTAWQTTVPRNAILARNLGQIVESLQSQPRHHYGLFMIDYTNKKYAKSPFYSEAVKRWAPYTGTNYEIGVTISGRPVEIYALLGGQWPHSSFMVPGGVIACAPTLTDVTRAWSILEHFRRNWLEPIWLGCSLERYEEIRSYSDFLTWVDERPEHAASDLGLFWLMSLDIGLDTYGRGHRKYMSWGYLPHEDRYQKPTIEGRNAAVIMKSGVYNAANNSHKLMDQSFTREDMTHAWYQETGNLHPYDRVTTPEPKNTVDHAGKYSWATAVSHQQDGRLETGPLARQLVAGGTHGEAWQHFDPLILDMYKQLGGPSVLLRHFARMHEAVKLYREAERILREFRLKDPWYIKPSERDGRGWGATEAIRGALCHWIELEGRQDQELPDRRAHDVERRPADVRRHSRPDRGGAYGNADRRRPRSGRGRPRLPFL